jgi:hypothetical protein
MIAVTRAITDSVADEIGQRHGLSRRQILLAATHTHYGPEFRPDKQLFFNIPHEFGAKIPDVANKLTVALTQAIDQSLTRLEPVRLFARKTTAGFAHNRRRHGVVDGTPAADDIIDHDVPVLECIDPSRNRKAIVFGYACHNTTIPPDDLQYCGDWAGFAKERLQRKNPGALALFIAGTGADQDPEPRGSVEYSRQHGQEIADAVQESLDRPGIEITGPVCAELTDVRLALQPVSVDIIKKMLDSDDFPQRVKARFLLESINRGDTLITSYSVPVQVVRFGNELLLIALSGEPVIDWAHKFKREIASTENTSSPSPQSPAPRPPIVWVAGYCNDMFGYLPTRRVQAEGGYEGGRANLWSWIPAPFTEDVEDRITVAVHSLVANVGLKTKG